MRFIVYKLEDGRWRFSNLRDIGGERDTWAEAWLEAVALAKTAVLA